MLNFSFSQQKKKLDSLYSIWNDVSQSDSLRIKAYDDYIWDGFLYSKPDSALVFAQELYDFALKKSNQRAIGNTLNLMGTATMFTGDYISSIKYYNESLEIWKSLKNELGIANAYGNIGLVYIYNGNYFKAIDGFKKSLKIKEKLNNKQGISNSLGNIGMAYVYLENYSKAIEYYKKGLILKRELEDKRGIAIALNNIGQILLEHEEDYNGALKTLNECLTLREELNDKRGVATALNNIGNTYYHMKDYPNAIEHIEKGITLMRNTNSKKALSNSLAILGEIKIEQKKYNSGISICIESLKIAQQINSINENKAACQCLYKGYKGSGNGDKALLYHEQMLKYNDSLKSEETAKKLQRMEFEKQVLADSLLQVEKDLKVEIAHQEEVRKKNRNKNIALAGGIFFLILSGGLYGRWRYVKKSKAIIEKEKDRSDNLLLNILPSEIAEELKAKGSADARDFDMVSILFTDFKGFTQASEKMTAKELLEEINVCFKTFDHICESYGIEKIKTIGDAYMAAGGLPVPSEAAAKNTVLAALEMQKFICDRYEEKASKNEIAFKMRVGIHTGPVVAGIVGVKKFQYDIWGDTVNTASRMESGGEIDKVNISEITYNLIKADSDFAFEARGKIIAKGKGEIEMYFVSKL